MALSLRKAAKGIRPPRRRRRKSRRLRRLRTVYRLPKRRYPSKLLPRRRRELEFGPILTPVLGFSALAIKARLRGKVYSRRRLWGHLRPEPQHAGPRLLPLEGKLGHPLSLSHPLKKRPRRAVERPISQVRYKPGLSKAWRLLRMQFCLAWGLT
jgi:hypothetical protein